MPYHFSFTAWPDDPAPAERPASGAGRRDDDVEADVERLASLVGRGLEFYRALVEAASRIAGGARAVVIVGERDCGADGEGSGRTPPQDRAASLRVDTGAFGPGGGASRLDAFARRVDRLLLRERACRALRNARAETRAFESRAAHDLRALVHPLLLHVDQLRRTGGDSAEELKLLDDLIASLVEWIEENLEEGSITEQMRGASDAGRGDAADVRGALEEVLSRSDRGGLTVSVPDRLPALAADRRLLEAGLAEMLRLGRGAPGRLELEGDGGREVRISYEFGEAREPPDSAPSEPEHRAYPPVTGGLLNLTARSGGTLRVEAGGQRGPDAGTGPAGPVGEGAGRGGLVEARLPASDPSAAGS